jgi:hypothetical protein
MSLLWRKESSQVIKIKGVARVKIASISSLKVQRMITIRINIVESLICSDRRFYLYRTKKIILRKLKCQGKCKLNAKMVRNMRKLNYEELVYIIHKQFKCVLLK